MPQIFLATTRRKAIFFGSLLAIFIAPVIFPYFRYAIWVFTGDYYRGFSFFVGLIFLFYTILVLQELLGKQRINLPLLIITAAFLLILLYFPYPNIKNLVDKDVQATARNFILLYTLIAGLSFIGSIKQYALIALLFLPVFELGIVNTTSLHQRSVVSRTELSQKTGYNDYALDAAKMINKEDPGFFRISKNYTSDPAIHSSFNDAKAQGFYSTMVYGSFNQKYYVKFMEETGVNKKGKETQSRWVVGLMNRTLLQTWASTKYKILKGNITPPDTIGYIQMGEMDNIRIFKNNHFLPLGFTYKYYIPADSFAKLESIKQDILLLKAFVTDDIKNPKYASLQQFSFNDTVVRYGIKEYYDDISILKKDTLAMTFFSQNRLKGTIELDSTKMLFFSIPYDKGWQATIDGKAAKPDICNIGFMGFLIEPGKHEVELFFIPPFFKLTLLLTLAGIFLYVGLAAFSIYLKKRRNSGSGSDISTNPTA
jgi:uncharacterized membrane protein YfhO